MRPKYCQIFPQLPFSYVEQIVLEILDAISAIYRYCIKAKSRPTASDNIDMTDFYDDDYDIDDDEDEEEEDDEDNEGEDSEDSGTGKA